MINKYSYGIICISGDKILMIKKAFTYGFYNFILGHYSNIDDCYRLLDSMTYHEKLDILTMEFSFLWKKIGFTEEKNTSDKVYINKKTKFETIFLKDRGSKLRKMITYSKNCQLLWEIPKGRSEENESPLQAGCREFQEETGMNAGDYTLLSDLTYIESFIDCNTRYINTYYFAEAIRDYLPANNFYFRQKSNEVSEIKWISKSMSRAMNIRDKMIDKILKKYKNFKKKYKI